jgi:hypothetical protein
MPGTVFAGERISLRPSGATSQFGGVALLDTRELVFEHVPFLGDHPQQELGMDSEYRCPAAYRKGLWAFRIFTRAVLA